MKKLKTLILAALTAGGACAAFGYSSTYIKADSTVWFDTASVPDFSDYNTVYVMYADSYDAWVEDGSLLATLGDKSFCSNSFADGSCTSYEGGHLTFTNDFQVGSDGDRSDQTVSDFAILFSNGDSGYFLVDTNLVTYTDTGNDEFTINMTEANAFTSADLKPFDMLPVTLPTGLASCSYVVSNLTEGAEAEIAPSGSMPGGATYELPIGAKVGIYCVPRDGYVVTGTNPYVIEEVTEGAFDESKLPTAFPAGTLCFTAEEDGSTVGMMDNDPDLWTPPTVQYLTEGKGWQDFTIGSTTVTLAKAEMVWFRGNNPDGFSVGEKQHVKFMMTGKVAASGSVMSLIDPTLKTTAIPRGGCFNLLFCNCTSLTAAPELPATTLAARCYFDMFYGCTSLTNAPALPATTLADGCYNSMFKGCSSLAAAPEELPATTLAEDCYCNMFYGCTSLTAAPEELPATTLTYSCYNGMFFGCTSLTNAPALPATTLVDNCYANMFKGCSSLTAAPELPATTLARYCYANMFEGCSSLRAAPEELPATTLADHCYFWMFRGCSSLTAAPEELPATTLAKSCYTSMFEYCTSLTTAPKLPAMTLAQECYYSMFYGCTSLTNAPALPATTLAESCYSCMFCNCTSLMAAPELPATTLAGSCYQSIFNGCTNINQVSVGFSAWEGATWNWLYNVAATGTFACPEALDVSTRDASHVPVGWNVVPPSVFVSLPTDVRGCSYVVSNLTEGVEIAPTEGNKYALPIGAKVGIYAVPEEGYIVTGTNPYVIEEVTEGTTLDESKLPKAVKQLQIENVTFRQRCWPWSGEVDVSFDMTGPAGEVDVVVTAYTNGTEKIDSFTATVTIPAEEFLTENLVWDAEDLGADFKSDDVTVEVELVQPVQLWEDGPYFAIRNVGAKTPEDYGWYFWWGDTVGYKRNAANDGWVSVVDGTTPIQFSKTDPTASQNREMKIAELRSEGWIDDRGNLVAEHDAATVKLGAPWRMMTKEEADKLADKEICECTSNWHGSVVGCLLRGKTTGYADKSIFIPGVGYGQDSNLGSLNVSGVYWTSSPHSDDKPGPGRAWYLNPYSNCNLIKTNHYDRCYGGTVRPVRDTPLPPASATSEKGTVDVREAVALAEGEVTISNVTYSDTAWGTVPETFTTVGWTNLTTGATGAFGNLSNIKGEGAKDVTLPTENGDYVLTHSTGDLTSFVTFTVSGYPIVTIPAAQGCTYVVSNLTEDVEIAPTEAGGSDYILPFGARVGIYAVPEEGYVAVGTNPYVIDSVPAVIDFDASKLPTAVREGTLCFTAEEDGATLWMRVGDGYETLPDVQYLIEGKGWRSFTPSPNIGPTSDSTMVTLAKGEKVWFRGNNPKGFSLGEGPHESFQIQAGKIAASGSVMSLINPTLTTTEIPCDYCFGWLFSGCTSLTVAPELPATELKDNCYYYMFFNCPLLTTAPELPATELKSGCYGHMFEECRNLSQVRVGFSAWEPSDATYSWLESVATKGTFVRLAPLAIREYGPSTVPVGWAVVPWFVGASDPADALAWFDETLKAVVVDNGMPGATNAIDLVTLADEMTKFGYEPAEKLANVFLTYASEDGEVAYLKPVEWFDADDVTKAYPTLDVALEAGVTAVLPNFVTEEIPAEIVETGKGEDGETYTAVLVNESAEGDVSSPVKAVYAEGLIDIATNEMVDVRMTVTPKSAESVPEDAARLLKLASTEDLDNLGGYKVDYVDLSVWYGAEQQTELDSVVAVHVPWNLRQDRIYRVARMHMHFDGQEGSWVFPIGEEKADDGEYVEFGADEIVVHTKKFSFYSIAEIGEDAGDCGCTLLLPTLIWLDRVAPKEVKEPAMAIVVAKMALAIAQGRAVEIFSPLSEGEKFEFSEEKLVEFLPGGSQSHCGYIFVSELIGQTELDKLMLGVKPIGWLDANDPTGEPYATLVDALKAGVRSVIPVFEDAGECGCTLLLPTLLWLDRVAPKEVKEPAMAIVVARMALASAQGRAVEIFSPLSEGEKFEFSKERLVEFLPGGSQSHCGYMFVSELISAADLKKLSAGVKPIGWLDANDPTGEPYATLEDALKAGVRSVIPVFAADPESTATGEVTYPKASSDDFLKEKATATWKAKAGDACVFAGWTWPKGKVTSAAFAALSENELKNPTLKVKVAEGEQVRPADVEATWAWIDEDRIGAVELTASGLAVESRSYVTASVSGLPSGLKFDKKSLAITGTAKKNETKTVKVTVKNASGYTVKQNFEVTVLNGAVTSVVAEDPVSVGSPVIVVGDDALGKTKGSKVYVAGKKASIKATPAKGSVFLGWYEDPDFKKPAMWLPKGYETASQSVVVPEEGLALYARFVRLEDWAVGNFTGDYYENGEKVGTAKLTVGSTGKVSGKVTVGGKSRSFSAKSFDDAVVVAGKVALVAHMAMKTGLVEQVVELLVGEGEANLAFGEGEEASSAILRRVE